MYLLIIFAAKTKVCQSKYIIIMYLSLAYCCGGDDGGCIVVCICMYTFVYSLSKRSRKAEAGEETKKLD